MIEAATCSCDRPFPLEDGTCLKCGRDAPRFNDLVRLGKTVRPLVDEYGDAITTIAAGATSDR